MSDKKPVEMCECCANEPAQEDSFLCEDCELMNFVQFDRNNGDDDLEIWND